MMYKSVPSLHHRFLGWIDTPGFPPTEAFMKAKKWAAHLADDLCRVFCFEGMKSRSGVKTEGNNPWRGHSHVAISGWQADETAPIITIKNVVPSHVCRHKDSKIKQCLKIITWQILQLAFICNLYPLNPRLHFRRSNYTEMDVKYEHWRGSILGNGNTRGIKWDRGPLSN